MYKIFVNEKPLTFRKKVAQDTTNLPYESPSTFDMAFDMLYNTTKQAVNIYYYDKEVLWDKFLEHVTSVHAAGGIVKNPEGKFLFIKRNGKWDLPKGHVEKGETNEEAALREVEEECSVKNLELGKFISTTYHVYFDKKYYLKVTQWFAMKYSGHEKPQPQTEENIEIVDWFSEEEIPGLMKDTYENIKRLVKNYLFENKN